LDNALPKYLEIAIYRIVQELVLNSVKHSDAKKASLRLAVSKHHVSIRIADYGKGFDLSQAENGGVGIRSIKNKLYMLKGTFEISSTPEKGTIVMIRIPVKIITEAAGTVE
jgi:signal transduction histidine kinase